MSFFILWQLISLKEWDYLVSRSNGGDNINIGFIGAGKVGVSLGKYFSENNIKIIGYYSKSIESAKDAAFFTKSNYFKDVEELIDKSDTIFITTPDGVIKDVWDSIKQLSIKNKIICHCSGSLSSKIFSNIEEYNSYGYSIHPMFAFSDKYNSHKKLKEAFITLEGSNEYLDKMKNLFESLGNKVQIISSENKAKYHAASVFASNQVIGLIKTSVDLLKQCGFDDSNALEALSPLMLNNMINVIQNGMIQSLTGPIERGDIGTVKSHLNVLDDEDKELYKLISKKLLDIAIIKNKDRDYTDLKVIMEE